MVECQVARRILSQRRVEAVDKIYHLLHLVPLCKAQSDTLECWLDFGVTVGYVELVKIDTLETRGD